jgi:membrane-associated phospholipid phosphatase
LGVITLWLVVETVKALTVRSRPYISLTNTRLLGWKERGMSFPSGHTAQTFYLMSLLIYAFRLPLGWAVMLFTLAVVVGFTRVYIGVHYPRDVVAGAILGIAWGILAALVDPYLTRGGYF